jgi:hypothetical protein
MQGSGGGTRQNSSIAAGAVALQASLVTVAWQLVGADAGAGSRTRDSFLFSLFIYYAGQCKVSSFLFCDCCEPGRHRCLKSHATRA